MANKRIYGLGDATIADTGDYYIIVDKSDLTEAEKINMSNFLKTNIIENQGITDKTRAVTPYSFYETQATTTRRGVVDMATNTEAANQSATDKVLSPSNMPSIFNDYHKRTKVYTASDFDDTASNYDSISVTNCNEMVINKFAIITGYLVFTLNAGVTNIEAVLNATITPLGLQGMNCQRFVTDRYYPHGGAASTSSGKLKMVFSSHDGSGLSAGTYEFAFQLMYLGG